MRARLSLRCPAIELVLVALLQGGAGAGVAPAAAASITSLVTNQAEYPDGQIPRFETLEVTVTLDRSYLNPFDPEEIRVDGSFRTPGGTVLIQPGFFYQEYRMATADGIESMTPVGGPTWKVRFTPREVGEYQALLRVTDRDGAAESEPIPFQVVPAANAGFISVSRRNPRYFERDDGAPFIGVGLNVAWWQSDARRVSTYDEYFARMAEAGANLARVWMVNSGRNQRWILSLQDRTLGADYNLEEAWAFDAIVELARQRGVALLLTLDDVNQYTYNWPDNLYNAVLGGPCGARSEIFTSPEARVFQQRVYRYVVARWGYAPNILSWELFNEIDELQWSDPAHWDRSAMIAWHETMARSIRSIDAHSHLVNTSTGSFKAHPDLHGLAEMGFAEIHFYYVPGCCSDTPSDPAGRDIADLTRAYAELAAGSVTAKPSLIGEWGLLDEGWNPSPYLDSDDRGVHLHNGLWASLMSGLAATGLSWHWQEHRRHGPPWWQHYRAVAAFFAGVGLEGLTALRPLNVGPAIDGRPDPRPETFSSSNPAIRVLGLGDGERIYAWVQNRDSTWWNAVHGGTPSPQDAAVVIAGLVPSRLYTVEWWDAYSGVVTGREAIAAGAGGSITLAVASLETDVAVKVLPVLPAMPRPPRPLLRRP